MVTRAFQSGGSRTFAVDYPTGTLALDLTADRSTLTDGQASVIVGRDVLKRNRLARGPGRKPVLTNRDTDAFQPGGPLTTAIRSDFHGSATHITRGYSGAPVDITPPGGFLRQATWDNCIYRSPRDVNDNRGEFAITALSDNWDPVNEAMVGGFFQVVSPFPYVRPKTIAAFRPVATGNIDSPAIYFTEEEWGDRGTADHWGDLGSGSFFLNGLDSEAQGTEWPRPFEFVITYRQFFDKRGIWVSDGQSFWLLHNGLYTKYLDLGADSGTLGTEWRGTQISPTLFMFVADNQLPRVIRLDTLPAAEATTHAVIPGAEPPARGGVTEVGDTEHLAGILPPSTSIFQERNAIDFFDFILPFGGLVIDNEMSSSTTGITMANPSRDALYRLKVRVVDGATGAASAFVNCFTKGGTLGVATTRPVDHRFPERLFLRYPSPLTDNLLVVLAVPPTAIDAPEAHKPLKTGRATHIEFWRTTSVGIDFFRELRKRITWPPTSFDTAEEIPNYSTMVERGADPDNVADDVWGVLGMSDAELLSMPLLTVEQARTGGLPPACRDVISIQAMTVCGGSGTEDVFYARQDKQILWPRLSSDEEIIHSMIRERLNQVESFYYGIGEANREPDLRRLSRQGDTFQAFTVAGDYALAVMRHGVHRIERDGASVKTQSLAERGAGTPWAKTVLSIGDVAMWATTNGLRIYNPTANDGAGVLSLIQYEEMSEWFAEALRKNMDVEAGFDERRGTLHFRRSLDGAFVDGAVYNLKFKMWSVMLDDNGFRYASSTHADTVSKKAAALYSIGIDGSVFEVNYEGTAHPYDGFAVQGTIETGGQFPPFGQGNPLTAEVVSTTPFAFTPAMEGDIIRFRSSRAALDGQVRVILSADSQAVRFGADAETQLPVPLQDGDEFIIGAVPFRVRFHPVTGAFGANVKTLEGLEVVARPGLRHSENPLWPDRPEAKLTIRAYRDIGDDPIETQPADIPIFADEDAEFLSRDRFSDAEIQGTGIEIELELLDARADFVLSRVAGRFREDGDQESDASTTD